MRASFYYLSFRSIQECQTRHEFQNKGLSNEARYMVHYILVHCILILLSKGFPTDVSFVEVSCVGSKVGFDKLRSLVKEKIDRLGGYLT